MEDPCTAQAGRRPRQTLPRQCPCQVAACPLSECSGRRSLVVRVGPCASGMRIGEVQGRECQRAPPRSGLALGDTRRRLQGDRAAAQPESVRLPRRGRGGMRAGDPAGPGRQGPGCRTVGPGGKGNRHGGVCASGRGQGAGRSDPGRPSGWCRAAEPAAGPSAAERRREAERPQGRQGPRRNAGESARAGRPGRARIWFAVTTQGAPSSCSTREGATTRRCA